MKTGLAALVVQIGIIAGAHAGGAAVLHLPIEGVTAKNFDQCAELLREKFAPALLDWKGVDVKLIKDEGHNLVQLRPERGHLSLGEVEKALVGSPFSIKRDQLEYLSSIRLRIGKTADPEKLANALVTLDGKKLHTRIREDRDGSFLITLRDPRVDRGKSIPLFTHQRLTSYLSKNKVKLISISWGNSFHRGAPFGARLSAAAAVARK